MSTSFNSCTYAHVSAPQPELMTLIRDLFAEQSKQTDLLHKEIEKLRSEVSCLKAELETVVRPLPSQMNHSSPDGLSGSVSPTPLNQDQNVAHAVGESGQSEDATFSIEFGSFPTEESNGAECVTEIALINELSLHVDLEAQGLLLECDALSLSSDLSPEVIESARKLSILNSGCHVHFLTVLEHLVEKASDADIALFTSLLPAAQQRTYSTKAAILGQIKWQITHNRRKDKKPNLQHRDLALFKKVLSDRSTLLSTLGEVINLPWFSTGMKLRIAMPAFYEELSLDVHRNAAHLAWSFSCILGIPVHEADITFVTLVWSAEVSKGHRVWEVTIRRPEDSLYHNWCEASFILARLLLCGVFTEHHNFQNQFVGTQLSAFGANFSGLFNAPGLKAFLPFGRSSDIETDVPFGYKFSGQEATPHEAVYLIILSSTFDLLGQTRAEVAECVREHCPLALALNATRHCKKTDAHLGHEHEYPAEYADRMLEYCISSTSSRQQEPRNGNRNNGKTTGSAARAAAAQPAKQRSTGLRNAVPSAQPSAPQTPEQVLESYRVAVYYRMLRTLQTDPRFFKYSYFAIAGGVTENMERVISTPSPAGLVAKLMGMLIDTGLKGASPDLENWDPSASTYWRAMLPSDLNSSENTSLFYDIVVKGCEGLIKQCNYTSPPEEYCCTEVWKYLARNAVVAAPPTGQVDPAAGKAAPLVQ